MEYSFEKAEKSQIKMEIKLGKEEWEAAIEQAYQKTKGKFSVQGFRKGKVPKKVLENLYGKGIFYEDAINEAFPKYYVEILEKEPTINAVARPDIDVKKIDDKGIVFECMIPVKPEVTLGEYKGIKFEKVEYNVTDEDVNADIERLRERNSRLIDVTDRAAKDGDTVVIDYSGSINGVKFDGGTAEKQNLTLGSHTFIPGFEEQVVGMNIGEEKDINVKFPEDYNAEDLKGKDAVFAIKLHEIKVKELPEVNDEFIKDAVGAESVEAYKKEVREKLADSNKKRAERELEDKIIKTITDNSTAEIPDAMVENQVDSMVQDMEYRFMYQGLKLADYLKYTNQTLEEYRNGFKKQAEEIVKSQVVIGKILEDEKIDATEEEVEAKVEEMAKAQGKEVPEYKKIMGSKQLDYVKNDVIIKKLFDFLKANNEIA